MAFSMHLLVLDILWSSCFDSHWHQYLICQSFAIVLTRNERGSGSQAGKGTGTTNRTEDTRPMDPTSGRTIPSTQFSSLSSTYCDPYRTSRRRSSLLSFRHGRFPNSQRQSTESLTYTPLSIPSFERKRYCMCVCVGAN